jgi:hypothetical protein
MRKSSTFEWYSAFNLIPNCWNAQCLPWEKRSNTRDCSTVHCNGETSVGWLSEFFYWAPVIVFKRWESNNLWSCSFWKSTDSKNLRFQFFEEPSMNQLLSQNNWPKPGSNRQFHRRFFGPVLRIFENSGYTSESALNVLRTTIMYWTKLFDFSDNNDYISLRTMGREPIESISFHFW